MRRSMLLCLGLLVFCSPGISQPISQKKADQLLSHALSAYHELEMDSSLLFFEEAALLFFREGNDRGYIRARSGQVRALSRQGKTDRAYALSLQTDSECKSVIADDPAAQIEVENTRGMVFFMSGKYDSALTQFQVAQRSYEHLPHDSVNLEAKIANNIGAVLHRKGDFAEAKVQYQKSLDLYKTILPNDPLLISQLLNNLGAICRETGLYSLAIDYYQEALAIRTSLWGDSHPQLANLYNNLGIAFQSTGQFEQALTSHQKALAIRTRTLDKDHINLAFSFNNLGLVYTHLGQSQQALDHFHKALLIRKKQDADPAYIADIYNNIGNLLLASHQGEGAITYYKKALALNQQLWQPEHPNVIQGYNNLTDAWMALEDPDAAAQSNDQALAFFPGTQILPMIRSLNLKAGIYLEKGKKNQNIADIEVARNAVFQAHALIQDLKNSLMSPQDKMTFNRGVHDTYLRGVETFFQRYLQDQASVYIDTALFFAEAGKASLLTEGLLLKSLITSPLVPESIWEQRSPAYPTLTFAQNRVEMDEIQNFLQTQYASLIEFVETPTALFLFYISPTRKELMKVNKPERFAEMALAFQRATGDIEFVTSQPKVADSIYVQLAHQLFQLLISPVDSFLPPNHNLVIVPDGLLGNLPFEVLLSHPVSMTGVPNKESQPASPNFRNLPYFFRSQKISYAFSANWLTRLPSTSPKAQRYGGFGPTYHDMESGGETVHTKNQFTDLPLVRQEIIQAAKTMGGTYWVGDAATETNFKSYAPDLNLIHLSTHGFIDTLTPMNSHLAFTNLTDGKEDGVLHAYELYGMKLNAQLAVLSACNTGNGSHKEGEGMLSLAHAFAYAGCPSIIMSHWNVPEEPTFHIIRDFFYELKNNKTVGDALWTSKLAYLDQAPPGQTHPVFWAGFSLVGRPDVFFEQERKRRWVYLGLLGMLMVVGLGWLLIKGLK